MTKVIQIKKEPDMKEIKILGLSLYKGIFKNQKKKYYVCGIPVKKIRITSKGIKKYFLGICYKFRRNTGDEMLLKEISWLQNRLYNLKDEINLQIQISTLHQKVFPQFKNINSGKDVVIVGAGPTLKDYKPIEGAVHIGVNRTFLCEKLDLNYLFLLDYPNVKPYIDQANCYKPKSCQKFYGLFSQRNHPMHIPDSYAYKAGALRYYISGNDYNLNEKFYYDIENNPLACFWSVIFQAAHFALYTNPRRLYIVGCDCNFNGYYDGKSQIIQEDELKKRHRIRNLDGWKKLKGYAELYYPETEIISINPVGLKGLFKDIYTMGEKN